MRIAVLGGGLAGVATIWHLLQIRPNLQITLYDPNGIGGGASGVAAGLLHPFAGLHAKLNRFGFEGMAATLPLLQISSEKLRYPVFRSQGILRLAMTNQQIVDYQTSVKRNPEQLEWITTEQCQSWMPSCAAYAGIFIRLGVEVNSLLYLQGLWMACEEAGAVYDQRAVASLSELDGYDRVIVAMGADCKRFAELKDLSISLTKGQLLEMRWPVELAPLSLPVSSQIYVTMIEEGKRCVVGATYEKSYLTELPLVDKAKAELLPKVRELIPGLEQAEVLSCRAGVRVSTPDHLPLIKRFGDKHWVMTGFGSKGLLYHSLYAKKLAVQILRY